MNYKLQIPPLLPSVGKMYLRQGKGREKRNKQVKTKDMKVTIKSFGSINRLYSKGVNICKGCEREYNGTCAGHCEANNFADCNRQAQRYTKEITALLAGHKE